MVDINCWHDISDVVTRSPARMADSHPMIPFPNARLPKSLGTWPESADPVFP